MQRAAGVHTEQLGAATDPEHRQPLAVGPRQERQLELVAIAIDDADRAARQAERAPEQEHQGGDGVVQREPPQRALGPKCARRRGAEAGAVALRIDVGAAAHDQTIEAIWRAPARGDPDRPPAGEAHRPAREQPCRRAAPIGPGDADGRTRHTMTGMRDAGHLSRHRRGRGLPFATLRVEATRMCSMSATSSPGSLQPPVLDDETGAPRKVGIEIELGGLDIDQIATAITAVFGGEAVPETDYRSCVDVPRLGRFTVTVDVQWLQQLGRDRAQGELGPRPVELARDALAALVEAIAPFEVSSPPVLPAEIPEIDRLVAELRARGGQGTKAGLLAAFGLHLNPRAPRLSVESLHAHLRAYAVLEPWLREQCRVDLVRRLSPFVDPYPPEFVDALLARDHIDSIGELIDLYLAHNPTRNRGLDMLPLFAHIDAERVAAVVDDDRVKPRPTFHYRLPDSRVDDADWGVVADWQTWLAVERAAACPTLLEQLILTARSTPSGAWPARCVELLAERGVA